MKTHDYTEFLSHIISEICEFAVDCGVEPDLLLKTVAKNITDLLQISTYNGWKRMEDE